MRKHFLLILLLFCTIKLTAQEISGLWQFNSITNNLGDTLLSVSDDGKEATIAKIPSEARQNTGTTASPNWRYKFDVSLTVEGVVTTQPFDYDGSENFNHPISLPTLEVGTVLTEEQSSFVEVALAPFELK